MLLEDGMNPNSIENNLCAVEGVGVLPNCPFLLGQDMLCACGIALVELSLS